MKKIFSFLTLIISISMLNSCDNYQFKGQVFHIITEDNFYYDTTTKNITKIPSSTTKTFSAGQDIGFISIEDTNKQVELKLKYILTLTEKINIVSLSDSFWNPKNNPKINLNLYDKTNKYFVKGTLNIFQDDSSLIFTIYENDGSMSTIHLKTKQAKF